MKRTTTDVSATRSANHHRTWEHCTVACSRDVIREHVVTARDEVDELHLTHGTQSHVCRAGSCTDDRRFGNRRVDNTLLAEFRHQSFSDLERTTIGADVFAKAEDILVALHFFGQAFANRLEISDLSRRASPSSPDARSHRLQ